MRDAQQYKQPGTDRADDIVVDHDRRSADALNNGSHDPFSSNRELNMTRTPENTYTPAGYDGSRLGLDGSHSDSCCEFRAQRHDRTDELARHRSARRF